LCCIDIRGHWCENHARLNDPSFDPPFDVIDSLHEGNKCICLLVEHPERGIRNMTEQIGLRANLIGRTALVTCASSGVDRSTALAFAREGVRAVVTARRSKMLDELVR